MRLAWKYRLIYSRASSTFFGKQPYPAQIPHPLKQRPLPQPDLDDDSPVVLARKQSDPEVIALRKHAKAVDKHLGRSSSAMEERLSDTDDVSLRVRVTRTDRLYVPECPESLHGPPPGGKRPNEVAMEDTLLSLPSNKTRLHTQLLNDLKGLVATRGPVPVRECEQKMPLVYQSLMRDTSLRSYLTETRDELRRFGLCIDPSGCLTTTGSATVGRLPKPTIPSHSSPPPPLPILPKAELSSAPSTFQLHIRSSRTPSELVDIFMQYIPTYWISASQVHRQLPSDIQNIYESQNLKLGTFLRKFQFYFDTQKVQGAGGMQVRVREMISHQLRGAADDLYGGPSSATTRNGSHRSSATHPSLLDSSLLTLLRHFAPASTPIPLSQWMDSLPNSVIAHKELKGTLPREEIAKTIADNPQYFQVVDNAIRKRPPGVAPHALAAKSIENSPFPDIIRSIWNHIPEDVPKPTAELFALLSPEEKANVKRTCRSFPRFLRLHGKMLLVSTDNMSVYRFHEDDTGTQQQQEKEEDHSTSQRLCLQDELSSSTDPVERACGELSDSLPIATAIPLEDARMCLCQAAREALTCMSEELPQLLTSDKRYREFVRVWRNGDDDGVWMIERASLPELRLVSSKEDANDVPVSEVIQAIRQVIPQGGGGLPLERLDRRLSSNIQRLLSHIGIRHFVKEHGQGELLISGDLIIPLS